MIVFARLLTYSGSAAAVIGLSLVHAARNGYDYAGSSRLGFSLGLFALVSLAAYGLGLPDLVDAPRKAFIAATQATVAAALGVSLLQLFLGDKLLPRFVVLGSPFLLVPWLTLCSLVSGRATERAAERARIFFVGTDQNRKALAEDLDREPERPARIVGGMDPEQTSERDIGELVDRVHNCRANVLVLDRRALIDENIVAEAAILHEQGLRTRTLLALYEEWLGKLPISELERAALMFDIGELHRVRYWRVKRLADIVVGVCGVFLLSLLLPFLYLAHLVMGDRHVFYRQTRVGKGGRLFLIYKLRTMPPNSDEATTWTTLEDPRITPLGRMLRRSHLDELPQVINILKGELSLIGPRPEQPQYVETLKAVLPYYSMRYLVTPGLTGWAQVKFGYAGTDADALEKLQYDFYYLSKQGFRLDLLIAGRTIRNIFGLRGR